MPRPPFERWTQDQYYQTAAFFAQVGLKADPASGGRMVGGTDVEAAKPLYEMVADTGSGEVVHDRTKQVAAPKFPFECAYEKPTGDASRGASSWPPWLTSKDNPYFARSYVNRLWGYLFGVGHHRAARRHPRRQPADQPRAARLPDRASSSRAASTSATSSA